MSLQSLKNSCIFSIVKLLSVFKKNRTLPSKLNSIAIFSTTGLGDALWSTPAIESLKRSYPEATITLITSYTGKEALLNHPSIDFVYVYSLYSFFKLFLVLRRHRFDVSILFHVSQRKIFFLSKLLTPHYLIGTKGRMKGLDDLLTHPVNPSQDEHEVKRRLNLIQIVGASPIKPAKLQIFLSEDEKKAAQFFLKTQGVQPNDQLVGLQLGSKDRFKRWPKEYFEWVGNRLIEKTGCKIILTGSFDEADFIRSAQRNIPGSIGLYGQVSLRVMMAIIDQFSLMISNDTGPMHIAFALNRPTIALFSPTDPMICGPYQTDGYTLFYEKKCCRPCLSKKCRDPFCLRQISKEAVLQEALHSILI